MAAAQRRGNQSMGLRAVIARVTLRDGHELAASTNKIKTVCGAMPCHGGTNYGGCRCPPSRGRVATCRIAVRMPVRGPTEKPAPAGRCIAGASFPQPYSTCSPCEIVFSGPAPHGLRMWQSHTGFLLAGVSQPALHGSPVWVAALCQFPARVVGQTAAEYWWETLRTAIHTEEQHVVGYLLLCKRFHADQLQSLVWQLHRRAQVCLVHSKLTAVRHVCRRCRVSRCTGHAQHRHVHVR